MMSLRAIARSAPRTVGRLTSTSLRRATPLHSTLRAPALASFKPLTATFSTSMSRQLPPAENEIDEQLSTKLESEIQFESELKESEPQPASVKDFLDSGLFEIEDVAGNEEVTLRRSYGNEK